MALTLQSPYYALLNACLANTEHTGVLLDPYTRTVRTVKLAATSFQLDQCTSVGAVEHFAMATEDRRQFASALEGIGITPVAGGLIHLHWLVITAAHPLLRRQPGVKLNGIVFFGRTLVVCAAQTPMGLGYYTPSPDKLKFSWCSLKFMSEVRQRVVCPPTADDLAAVWQAKLAAEAEAAVAERALLVARGAAADAAAALLEGQRSPLIRLVRQAAHRAALNAVAAAEGVYEEAVRGAAAQGRILEAATVQLSLVTDGMQGRQLLIPVCVHCTRQPGNDICTGCRMARYCSKECQLADWPHHKAACRVVR